MSLHTYHSTQTFTHTYTCANPCTHARAHMYICAHTYTCAQTRVHRHKICTHTRVHRHTTCTDRIIETYNRPGILHRSPTADGFLITIDLISSNSLRFQVIPTRHYYSNLFTAVHELQLSKVMQNKITPIIYVMCSNVFQFTEPFSKKHKRIDNLFKNSSEYWIPSDHINIRTEW